MRMQVWTRAGAIQGAQGWGSRSRSPLPSPSPAGLGLLALPALSTSRLTHSFNKYLLAIYYPSAGMRRVNETKFLAS